MSIFDIFKRNKPKTVTIEVMGNTYVATPERKELTDEGKERMANRRRYLLDHLDALIDKASSLSLDEAAGQLREYKRYNERMLTQ